MSLRLYRVLKPPQGTVVELGFSGDTPVILYGHDGFTYEQGELLKRWAALVAPTSPPHHILTDTEPAEPEQEAGL